MQGPCHGPSECILPSFIVYHMPWKLQSIWYTLIALRCMPCNTHCRSVVHQSHKASGCCIGASPRPSILNQSHICQARHPTLTCGSFNHICSQLRLENQVSCGLHITATLSPGHQHDMHKHLNSPSISKEPFVTSSSGCMQMFRKAVVTPKSSSCCQSTGPAKSRNSV